MNVLHVIKRLFGLRWKENLVLHSKACRGNNNSKTMLCGLQANREAVGAWMKIRVVEGGLSNEKTSLKCFFLGLLEENIGQIG